MGSAGAAPEAVAGGRGGGGNPSAAKLRRGRLSRRGGAGLARPLPRKSEDARARACRRRIMKAARGRTKRKAESAQPDLAGLLRGLVSAGGVGLADPTKTLA